jgi:hypothetical protein
MVSLMMHGPTTASPSLVRLLGLHAMLSDLMIESFHLCFAQQWQTPVAWKREMQQPPADVVQLGLGNRSGFMRHSSSANITAPIPLLLLPPPLLPLLLPLLLPPLLLLA